MNGVEILGLRAAERWISRGWRLVRIFADRDGQITYTVTKDKNRSHRKPPKPRQFAALFGRESSCKIN